MKVYNWNDIPEESPRNGLKRRGFRSAGALVVRNEFEPKIDTFPHSHDCDQLAMIMSGRAIFNVGGQAHEVGPGSVFLIPANVEHYLEPVGDEKVINIDVFSPVREDYLHMVEYQKDTLE